MVPASTSSSDCDNLLAKAHAANACAFFSSAIFRSQACCKHLPCPSVLYNDLFRNDLFVSRGEKIEMRKYLLHDHLLKISVVLLLGAGVAGSQAGRTSQATPAPAVTKSAAASPDTKTAERPAPRFDIANIDKTADPCVDFYQFACGNWIKNNPIPGDQPVWLSFSEVYEHNLVVLRRILEKASVNDPKRDPIRQKIGD